MPRRGRPTGPMPSAETLAGLVPAVPPKVTASGISERTVSPAMLAWGWHEERGWHAGISFIYNRFLGSPLRAVITLWISAESVKPLAGENYERVPVVPLTGGAGGWPVLPGRYPKAGPEWESRAVHSLVADPYGEYAHLADQIRKLG